MDLISRPDLPRDEMSPPPQAQSQFVQIGLGSGLGSGTTRAPAAPAPSGIGLDFSARCVPEIASSVADQSPSLRKTELAGQNITPALTRRQTVPVKPWGPV